MPPESSDNESPEPVWIDSNHLSSVLTAAVLEAGTQAPLVQPHPESYTWSPPPAWGTGTKQRVVQGGKVYDLTRADLCMNLEIAADATDDDLLAATLNKIGRDPGPNRFSASELDTALANALAYQQGFVFFMNGILMIDLTVNHIRHRFLLKDLLQHMRENEEEFSTRKTYRNAVRTWEVACNLSQHDKGRERVIGLSETDALRMANQLLTMGMRSKTTWEKPSALKSSTIGVNLNGVLTHLSRADICHNLSIASDSNPKELFEATLKVLARKILPENCEASALDGGLATALESPSAVTTINGIAIVNVVYNNDSIKVSHSFLVEDLLAYLDKNPGNFPRTLAEKNAPTLNHWRTLCGNTSGHEGTPQLTDATWSDPLDDIEATRQKITILPQKPHEQ